LSGIAASLNAPAAAWIETTAFKAGSGGLALLPDASGSLSAVLLGLGEAGTGVTDPFAAGALASLPAGTYYLASGFDRPDLAALAAALGGYRYPPAKASKDPDVSIAVPEGVGGDELRRVVVAVTFVRDLVNTPANRMGPADLAAAAREVAAAHQAAYAETIGTELLSANYPLIHAVGAAAAPGREPRLVDIIWGDPDAPKVTLVGKGVCFDTGGLDIKNAAGMQLMKKDMGGAAHAMALASLIMGAGLPVRLRVLVPAVENAISGAAQRPGDVVTSRKGLTVEIGNTDAEGRLILADALALASEEKPELLIDFATLTGAARVALGPELPAVFTADESLATELAAAAEETADPVWRMPLWTPYLSMIESRVADLDNAGKAGFAGAITAALFLSRFVGEGVPWLHADIFAWNPSSRPGRPEGGEAQTIRALYAVMKRRYPTR
jgi:leucyl aminopeptidase